VNIFTSSATEKSLFGKGCKCKEIAGKGQQSGVGFKANAKIPYFEQKRQKTTIFLQKEPKFMVFRQFLG
jgi:hypothetical protein